MYFSQLTDKVFDNAVGAGGIARGRFEQLLAATSDAIAALQEKKQKNSLPILNLPYDAAEIANIERIAGDIRTRFKDVVVLGTGGSSLGGQTLAALTANPFTRHASTPRLHFVDNVDPHTLNMLLRDLPLSSTAFIVISKSGGTVETITQFLLVAEAFSREPSQGAFAKHCFVITIAGDSPLYRLAGAHKIPVIAHDPNVGGRFSVLSVVGLLPAAIVGVDIAALRMGAREVMDNALTTTPLASNQVAVGAALHAALMESGKSVSVLMPYADRLACFGRWYVQLWAESIGKSGKGSTPVCAIGSIDQHSQLQLYLDGPRDKFITLILLSNLNHGSTLIVPAEEPSLSYLRNRKTGEVMQALQTGTLGSLMNAGCPVRVMELPELNAHTLGALLMFFMLETIVCADLMGVNAFDQPAVEDGKRIAREYLARG